MHADLSLRIRTLEASDLEEANQILRLAFGTYLNVAHPESMFPGRDLIGTRWRANSSSGLGAEHAGKLIATSFAANWGAFGFFGPITVLPEYWDRQVGQALLGPMMELFEAWGIQHRGLFTFPQSPKHIHLYEKYGFRAGHLTPIMKKTLSGRPAANFERLSALPDFEQASRIDACRSLTGELLEGLDLTRELRAVVSHHLGDVCLIYGDRDLLGFAVCHCGADTEAGDGVCYVKFGAVRTTDRSRSDFSRLLTACEAVAHDAGLGQLTLGMNMGRRRAYEHLRESGFQTEFIGVAMETHPERSYNRPDTYIVDDWR